MEDFNYYTEILPAVAIALVVLHIAATLTWNLWWVPKQRLKRRVIRSYGSITGDILKLALSKETSHVPASKEGKESNPKKEVARKVFSGRSTTVALLAVTVVLLALGPGMAVYAAISVSLLLLSVLVLASPVLSTRSKIQKRMFEVAKTIFRYDKNAELQPWGYVRIKKWVNLTTPGETVITVPPTYNTSSFGSRDAFENHFNSTVTDDNSWSYEWKPTEGQIIAKPVGHIPTRATYPGAGNHDWNIIPVGIGVDGEVSFDFRTTPHALVCGTTGSGKSLSLKTPVFTKAGWKTVGTIETGDIVYGPDGKEATVAHLHPIFTPAKAYKVKFKSGEEIITDPEHLWETISKKDAISTHREGDIETDGWIAPHRIQAVLEAYHASDNTDTIDISEVKQLAGLKTSSALYRIAQQVGVAELVRKTAIVHYAKPTVTRAQRFTAVEVEEFLSIYNSRANHPTAKNPLTAYNFEKLTEYAAEARNTDTVTLEDILAYTGAATRLPRKWMEGNLDFTLPTDQMFATALEEAKKVANPFPTKIFSIESPDGYVTFQHLAQLSPGASHKDAKNFFYYLAAKAKSRKIITRDQEQVWPDSGHQIQTGPVPHYPKRLFLRALLERSGNKVAVVPLPAGATIKTTAELTETLKSGSYLYKGDTLGSSDHYIRTTIPLEGEEKDLPVGPYTLGAYLGDGYSSSGVICGEDDEVFSNIEAEGYKARRTSLIPGYANNFREVAYENLREDLQGLGIVHKTSRSTNKFFGEPKAIPEMYLTASEEQRRQLLRGLLDTDGSVKSDGRVTFSNTNKAVIDNFIALVAGLGYVPLMETTRRNQEKSQHWKDVFHVHFIADPKDRLFGLTRKNLTHQQRHVGGVKDHMATLHKVISIEEVTPEPMRCISVDSEDRLFLVGRNLIPTHNSVLQRNLIFHCIQHNDMWRFLGVDVKRVELTPFKKYSQTVLGIGANLEDGVEIVRYVNELMKARYEQMERVGVNNFIDLKQPDTGRTDYFIMLMVDEAFMFMSPEGNKTDEGKMRDQLHAEASSLLGDLARLGRAAGIHLVLATQRPDATVIKGELKANLDVRIAAGRLDSTPSSMVLDSGAATTLPGNVKGRGIIRFGGNNVQFQGYFAEQDWIDEWIKANPHREPEFARSMGWMPGLGEGETEEIDPAEAELDRIMIEGGYDFEDGEISSDPSERMEDPEEEEAPAPLSMPIPAAQPVESSDASVPDELPGMSGDLDAVVAPPRPSPVTAPKPNLLVTAPPAVSSPPATKPSPSKPTPIPEPSIDLGEEFSGEDPDMLAAFEAVFGGASEPEEAVEEPQPVAEEPLSVAPAQASSLEDDYAFLASIPRPAPTTRETIADDPLDVLLEELEEVVAVKNEGEDFSWLDDILSSPTPSLSLESSEAVVEPAPTPTPTPVPAPVVVPASVPTPAAAPVPASTPRPSLPSLPSVAPATKTLPTMPTLPAATSLPGLPNLTPVAPPKATPAETPKGLPNLPGLPPLPPLG